MLLTKAKIFARLEIQVNISTNRAIKLIFGRSFIFYLPFETKATLDERVKNKIMYTSSSNPNIIPIYSRTGEAIGALEEDFNGDFAKYFLNYSWVYGLDLWEKIK